jgi:hypothetical protein
VIVDWTLTNNHYVDYALKDASSNKQFQPKTTTNPSACVGDMGKIRAELSGKMSDNNEARSCQVAKSAIVGLLWGPAAPNKFVQSATTAEWAKSKKVFGGMVRTLQAGGIGADGLPIFCYDNGPASQKLECIDFIT